MSRFFLLQAPSVVADDAKRYTTCANSRIFTVTNLKQMS